MTPPSPSSGNLTADPELRFTRRYDNGEISPWRQRPRIYDRQTGEWKDGGAVPQCNIWQEAAENVAEPHPGHESSLAGGLSA